MDVLTSGKLDFRTFKLKISTSFFCRLSYSQKFGFLHFLVCKLRDRTQHTDRQADERQEP